jgi:NADH-quinone oxidoreductase subunit L
MGGLKQHMPITFALMWIATLAIAGIPIFAGFFSKDEILYKTFVGTPYHHGSTILWLVGMITALMTAAYMFRLVFLTFHGAERFAAAGHGPSTGSGHGPSTGSAHGHDSHGGHGHAGHGHGTPHEAPMSMAVPLIILAIGSAVAGFVGVPHALGGHNAIEGFLEPAFEVHGAATAGEAPVPVTEPAVPPAVQTESAHAAAGDVGTERMLMVVSVAVAIAGIFIAAYFWLWQPSAAAGLARSFSGVHKLLLNKYYLDEIYDAVIVQPIKQLSTGALWKGVDAGMIDGSVNGVGAAVQGTSASLRRVQTGSVRTYAASLFLGAVLILGWYLWS